MLQEDAPEDLEIAKAVVETLSLLCEVEEVDGRVSFTSMWVSSASPCQADTTASLQLSLTCPVRRLTFSTTALCHPPRAVTAAPPPSQPVRDDSGLRNTDVFLSTPTPLHTLLTLLTPTHFYLRFFSLQLMGILLGNRSSVVQSHVLTAAGGVGRLVETLDDNREIIRNGAFWL